MIVGMGNPKGVKRDFEALEKRRLKAVRLLEKEWSQSQVARKVGVHRQSVSRWAQQLAASGRAGLKKAGRAGRKPRTVWPELFRDRSILRLANMVPDVAEKFLQQARHFHLRRVEMK